jgi:hypothetical protein
MRSIRFEESSVLAEFAGLMEKKKGLVKSAAESLPGPQMPGFTRTQIPNSTLGPKKDIDVQAASRHASILAELKRNGVPDALAAQIATDIEAKLKANSTPAGEPKSVEQDVSSSLAAKNIKLPGLLNKLKAVITGIKTASAKDQLYDVSGETGEKLVDEAHPDTAKIEGTDQIVENLTEQQKADLAAVEKKPTGKYAQMQAELIALADELDAMGLTKEADRVDGLLKKKADDVTDKQVLRQGPPTLPVQPGQLAPDVQPSDPNELALVAVPPKRKKLVFNQAVQDFQNKYNAFVPNMGEGWATLKPDGYLGKLTMTAMRMLTTGNPNPTLKDANDAMDKITLSINQRAQQESLPPMPGQLTSAAAESLKRVGPQLVPEVLDILRRNGLPKQQMSVKAMDLVTRYIKFLGNKYAEQAAKNISNPADMDRFILEKAKAEATQYYIAANVKRLAAVK